MLTRIQGNYPVVIDIPSIPRQFLLNSTRPKSSGGGGGGEPPKFASEERLDTRTPQSAPELHPEKFFYVLVELPCLPGGFQKWREGCCHSMLPHFS